MEVLFFKILMWIELSVLTLVDKVFELFNIFGGLDEVEINGAKEDLLLYFLTNEKVITVFSLIACIGVMVAIILTIVALIKNMLMPKKSVKKIFAKFLVSITTTFVVAGCMICMIFMANGILWSIDKSFNIENKDITVGGRIFESTASGSYDAGRSGYTEDESAFQEWYNEIYKNSGLSTKEKVDKTLGVYKKNMGFEDMSKTSDNPVVDDEGNIVAWEEINNIKEHGYLSIDHYNYILGLLATIILGVVAFTAILGLVARLYDLVFLLLSSPLFVATINIDDGAKFKLWRETTISKTFLAYGTILAVNIYILIIPIINKISIPGEKFIETLAKILLIVCGALTVSSGQILFARLLGTDASESREMSHGMKQVFAGGLATAKLVGSAGKLAFGSKGVNGTRSGGLVGTTGKTLMAAGKFLGGNAFSNTASKVGQGAKDLGNKIRTGFMSNGGVLGMAKRGAQGAVFLPALMASKAKARKMNFGDET